MKIDLSQKENRLARHCIFESVEYVNRDVIDKILELEQTNENDVSLMVNGQEIDFLKFMKAVKKLLN